MIGKKFGRLTVLRLVEKRGYGKIYECMCDCGAKRNVFAGNLRSGKSTSCGCFRNEKIIASCVTHGATSRIKGRSPEYRTWTDMKTRCTNHKADSWHLYGGRGIKVCDRWAHSYENFIFDMGVKPFPNAQLDRIDNNKDYAPDNCRWVTPTENQRNKRNSAYLSYGGDTMTVADWADKTGIKAAILYKRIYRGWSTERILTQTPKGEHHVRNHSRTGATTAAHYRAGQQRIFRNPRHWEI